MRNSSIFEQRAQKINAMDVTLDKMPLDAWEQTKITLHLYLQIIGKIHLALHPKKNHWWHVTYHITPIGLTTGPIPYKHMLFSIEFDFLKHRLLIQTSMDKKETISLLNGLSVSEFYRAVFSSLKLLGINVSIHTKPFDPKRVKSDIPFEKDNEHRYYDNKYVSQYFKVLIFVYSVLEEFSGQFVGKSTPVHLFWHTFDLALTRFSGHRVAKEKLKGMDPVTREAYSHEVISFGFWAGDDNIREPAFYSYTFPEPKDLTKQTLQPEKAFWQSSNGNSLAILKYHDLINYDDPRAKLREFFDSVYSCSARLAGWDINDLKN